MRAQRRGGFESDRWYLDAYDRARGTKRVVFESPDLSVGDYALSPDGSAIWFVAGEQGRENLYTVPAAGGTPKRIAEGGAISGPQPRQRLRRLLEVVDDDAAGGLPHLVNRQRREGPDARRTRR